MAIYSALATELAAPIPLELCAGSSVSTSENTDVLCQPLTRATCLEMRQRLGDVQITHWHRLQQEESVSTSSCDESANPWEVLS